MERRVLESPPLAGVVLRYGHLYGPGTGAVVATAPRALHIDAAAWATVLAVERAEPGIYSIADPSPHLNTGKARTKLDWSADCGPPVIPRLTS
jgi:hypothetical protein